MAEEVFGAITCGIVWIMVTTVVFHCSIVRGNGQLCEGWRRGVQGAGGRRPVLLLSVWCQHCLPLVLCFFFFFFFSRCSCIS